MESKDPTPSTLPPLRDLKVTLEDKVEWCQLAATRAWFKSLQNMALDIQNSLANRYNRENADETFGSVAEAIGAIRVIQHLLNQQMENKERMFSEADLEEIVDG